MDFEYIPTSVRGPGSKPLEWEVLAGCDCVGECSAEQSCACLLGAEVS